MVLDRAGNLGRKRLTLSSPPMDSNGDSASGSIGLLELGLLLSIFNASRLEFNSSIGFVFVFGRLLGIFNGTISCGSSLSSAFSKGLFAYNSGLTLLLLVGLGLFGRSSVLTLLSVGLGLGRMGGKKSR